MGAKLIDGKKIAGQIRNEVSSGVLEMKRKHDIEPGLAVILVGDDPASAVYVRNKERDANAVGMNGEIFNLPHNVSEEDLLSLVHQLNMDTAFHGILVQMPLPREIDENRIISAIDPLKDVDGLHPYNVGLLASGNPRFIPATPAGIEQMLLRTDNNPSGKHVVVLGRSNIVGRPVANLLSLKRSGGNATVTVCHSGTYNLCDITREADILITAIGRPKYVTEEMITDEVVVIDVGINRIANPSKRSGYELIGDVDFRGVSRKASAITPVPGGVGPMTIAMLLSNTLRAARDLKHPNGSHV